LLFGRARVVFLARVPVYTRILLIAVTALLEKAANRNLLFNVAMQVLAGVALTTHFFEPMHTYLLLELRLIRQRVERVNCLLQLVKSRIWAALGYASARAGHVAAHPKHLATVHRRAPLTVESTILVHSVTVHTVMAVHAVAHSLARHMRGVVRAPHW